MVLHWSLSDSKSPHVSNIPFSILADLNKTVVWMVTTRPLIFESSSPGTSPLVTVLSELITIGITVTFMFHITIIPLRSFSPQPLLVVFF